MSNFLDIDELRNIQKNTLTKLNSLKSGWNDNDQKEFYNDKVNELENFIKITIEKVNKINNDFIDLDNELKKY